MVLLLLCIPFFDVSLYKVFFLSLALGRRKCCRKLPSPSPPTNECFHNPNFQHLPLTSSARCCWFKYRRDSLVQPLNSESIEMTGQCKGIGNKTTEILTGLSPSVPPHAKLVSTETSLLISLHISLGCCLLAPLSHFESVSRQRGEPRRNRDAQT